MVKTIKIQDDTHFILNKIKAEKRFKSFDAMLKQYYQINEDVKDENTKQN